MPSEAMTPVVKRPGRAAPEKRLQHQIRRALERLGCEVLDLTQPRRTMLPLGLPDLYVRHEGWRVRVWMEVKTERGRLSPWQEAWLARERAAGGHAAVVRSVEDAIHALREAGAPTEMCGGRWPTTRRSTPPPTCGSWWRGRCSRSTRT